MSTWLDRILASPGIHFAVTRFAGAGLRGRAFDARYRTGQWASFDRTVSPELLALVEQYAGGGRILSLGCGSGSLVVALAPGSYDLFIGVDLASVAIQRARARHLPKTRFEIADLAEYRTDDVFDLILFEESLYYVPQAHYDQVLNRYQHNLRPGAVFLVTIADPTRFEALLHAIRRNYGIIEDRSFANSRRRLLVFR